MPICCLSVYLLVLNAEGKMCLFIESTNWFFEKWFNKLAGLKLQILLAYLFPEFLPAGATAINIELSGKIHKEILLFMNSVKGFHITSEAKFKIFLKYFLTIPNITVQKWFTGCNGIRTHNYLVRKRTLNQSTNHGQTG